MSEQERLLGDLLRVVRVVGHPEGEPVHTVLVSSHEHGECAPRTRAGTGGERLVRGIRFRVEACVEHRGDTRSCKRETMSAVACKTRNRLRIAAHRRTECVAAQSSRGVVTYADARREPAGDGGVLARRTALRRSLPAAPPPGCDS